MTRTARKIGISDIYHVVMKGINNQDIFEETQDYIKFTAIIMDCQNKDHFELFAYCLMNNHIHMLLRTNGAPLGLILKRIGSSYACWFNKKYIRKGHLFYNRYFSEPVDDRLYFLYAWRYIMQNPMNAGMETKPGEKHRFTSLNAYLGENDGITDTEFIKRFFADDDDMKLFLFTPGKEDRQRMNIASGKHLDDETAKIVLRDISNCANLSDFQKLSMDQRRAIVCRLYKENKISIRQINRITGMSPKTIQKALRRMNDNK